MNFLSNIIKMIFFHPTCTICGKFGYYLCKKCENDLDTQFKPTIVNTPYRNVICASPFVYQGSIRKIIHKYKFQYQKNFFRILSPFLSSVVREKFKNQKFDLITSVPVHLSSLNERKYNHSELLSLELSKELNIPYENCLIKTKKNKIQHNLSFCERQMNVKGVYEAIKNYENKKILLCDDIITTGSTLSSCVEALEKRNATVTCVTVAFTIRNNSSS